MPVPGLLEQLGAAGEVVVTDRRPWKRAYDLAGGTIPNQPTDDWVDNRGVHGHARADCGCHLLDIAASNGFLSEA